MSTVDYRIMAEDWLEHIVGQYEMTHVCRKDLLLIEHLLRAGLPVVAFRDMEKVLHVQCLLEARSAYALAGSRG